MAKIAETKTQVVAVSYDSQEVLARFARVAKVEFPLLADVGSKTIDAFGIRNQEETGSRAGIPHPITFIVDEKQVVRAKLPGEVRVRHTTDELLKAISGIE